MTELLRSIQDLFIENYIFLHKRRLTTFFKIIWHFHAQNNRSVVWRALSMIKSIPMRYITLKSQPLINLVPIMLNSFVHDKPFNGLSPFVPIHHKPVNVNNAFINLWMIIPSKSGRNSRLTFITSIDAATVTSLDLTWSRADWVKEPIDSRLSMANPFVYTVSLIWPIFR